MFLFFVFKRITNLHYYHEYQRTQRDNTHMSASRRFFESNAKWAHRILLGNEADFIRVINPVENNGRIYCSHTYPGGRGMVLGGHTVHEPQIGHFATSRDDNWDGLNCTAYSRQPNVAGTTYAPLDPMYGPFLQLARKEVNRLQSGEGILFFVDSENKEWYIKSDSFEPDEIVRLYSPPNPKNEHGVAGSIVIKIIDLYIGAFNFHGCTYANRVFLVRSGKDIKPIASVETYKIEPNESGAITLIEWVREGVYTRRKYDLTINLNGIAKAGEIVDLQYPITAALVAQWPSLRGPYSTPQVDIGKVRFLVGDRSLSTTGLKASGKDYFCTPPRNRWELINTCGFPTHPF